jgi:hypothetical protein
MYTGFVTINRKPRECGKHDDALQITLVPAAALQKLFDNLPTSQEVAARFSHSDSRSKLLVTIRRMDVFKQELSTLSPLELTSEEFEIFRQLRKKVFKGRVTSFDLSRIVGESFTGEKQHQVARFLWNFYIFNENGRRHTNCVRSDIKCEKDGLNMSNPELMDALGTLSS